MDGGMDGEEGRREGGREGGRGREEAGMHAYLTLYEEEVKGGRREGGREGGKTAPSHLYVHTKHRSRSLLP